MKLLLGDCLEKLKELEDNSVDSIVTDPPYHLTSIVKRFGKPNSAPAQQGTDGAFVRASKGFMGKEWDGGDIAQRVDVWLECMRVLKPGGHLLAFSGSRTYHRMAVAIEDAGFEIRDQIMWIYGSGFPKSHNIGKAVDKIQGNEREVVGENPNHRESEALFELGFQGGKGDGMITKGNTEWEGWGTALKPSHEPIVMARKPFKGNVAQNVLEWGTGGINVDGCRIGTEKVSTHSNGKGNTGDKGIYGTYGNQQGSEEREGRFPANIIFECTCDTTHTKPAPKSGHWPKGKTKGFGEFGGGESSYEGVGPKEEGDMVIHTDPNCPCYILDQQSGTTKSSKRGAHNNKKTVGTNTYTPPNAMYSDENTYGDTGGASRFFYCPKANKSDRDEGMDLSKDKQRPGQTDKGLYSSSPVCKDCGKTVNGTNDHSKCKEGLEYRPSTTTRKNIHPTVKPTDLMAYLIRLVTPKGGIVLDPFMGSGSTGKAAVREGMEFIGIEREAEYMEIAKHRIEYELDKKQLEESKRKFW